MTKFPELLILNPSHRPRPPIEAIQVSSERMMPVSSARNLGVVFDQEINLVEHVTTICKTCFLHLRNIAKIRHSLSQKDTESLVHAFISSKLDSCNSLLFGLPQTLIDRLQAVQNCAARLVTYGCRSFSSAAPTIWNSLPEPIRNHDDISKFKTYIKTFLFKEHFN